MLVVPSRAAAASRVEANHDATDKDVLIPAPSRTESTAELRGDIDWAALRNRPLSIEERRLVREHYDARYQQRCSYRAGHPWHRAIAIHRLRLAATIFRDLGKVLDAGCASGEIVSAFRFAGADCWGFDLCPDLHDVVYEAARPYVRIGRFDAIPYSDSDGFKTLVSHDVFEHVPIDELEALPGELARLGITQVACIISNDTESEGHITIQDLDWYEELFARAGFRLLRELDEALAQMPVPAGWNDSRGEPIWLPYHLTGDPANGWNRVPGHLFWIKD